MNLTRVISFDTATKIRNPLQKDLIAQFTNAHKEVRKSRFLENPEKAGTFVYAQEAEWPSPDEKGIVQPILRYDPDELKERAVSLQKWEGVVIAVEKDIFQARLLDLTDENPEEQAEFLIEEISDDDRELLRPGAVFYWSLGYLTTGTGQRIRTSIVKFRRLPAWTERDMRMAQERAKEIRQTIGWGSDEAAAGTG